MALPNSGQLSTDEVYEERWGDGASPSGSYSLGDIANDWLFPSSVDNTDIFYGRGRPEGTTERADTTDAFSATLNGTVDNAGGYSPDNAATAYWRFRYKETSSSTWNHTSEESISYTFTGDVDALIGTSSDTQYEYQLQIRNVHDDGDWQTFNTRTFTSPSM